MKNSNKTMKLVVYGLNYKTAPLDIREKLSFSKRNIDDAVEFFLKNNENDYYGVQLSTCNRVEIYFAFPDATDEDMIFKKFIQYVHNIDMKDLNKYIYKFTNVDLARHLYQVTSGLDSMVMGENQIVGQVKNAYYEAKSSGITNSELNHLFESALRTGKKVRTETDIDKFPVSVSGVAVKLVENNFHNLNNMTVLIVGAGKMSELTCRNLYKRGANSIIVSSRTHKNAQRLAEKFNGKSVPFHKLEDYLLNVNIVITQTASPHPIMTYNNMKKIMKKRDYRHLFIIDIAVPRDVEEECRKIKNLSLNNVDDLQIVSNKNRDKREKETEKCKEDNDRRGDSL